MSAEYKKVLSRIVIIEERLFNGKNHDVKAHAYLLEKELDHLTKKLNQIT